MSAVSIAELCLACLLMAGHSVQLNTGTASAGSSSRLHQRQADSAATPTMSVPPSATKPASSGSSVTTVLSNYWYVCLVVVVIVLVACTFLCACIVRKKRQHGHLQIGQIQLLRVGMDRHTDTSHGIELTSAGSPVSTSLNQSPVSSPQPSFSSSHKSMRSSGHGSGRNKRRRNPSPGRTSSGSEDTIRPSKCHSVSSLASSVSTLGPHSGRLHTESFSSGRGSDRGTDGHGSDRVGIEVPHHTSPSRRNHGSPLRAAPSSLSIESGRSFSRPSSRASDSSSHVKVDVKVHLGQEEPDHFQIAAALAESARQLAQSAANFEQEDSWSHGFHSPHSNLSSPRGSVIGTAHHPPRRQLFYNHSSSALMGDHLNSGFRKHSLPTANLDRPANLVSLDRPANFVSLDKPANLVSLDKPPQPVNMRSLERPLPSRRMASCDSDSVLSIQYPRHNELGSTHTTLAENRLYSRGDHHTPNRLLFHQQLQHTSHSRGDQSHSSGADVYGAESDAGTKSGSGCDSNASTLKALPIPLSRRKGDNFNTAGVGGVQSGDHQDSSHSNGVQDVPPSPQSSQPSLSPRTDSALSLDPPLSSTASGYAATGSTSSLDTISKTTNDAHAPADRARPNSEHAFLLSHLCAPVGAMSCAPTVGSLTKLSVRDTSVPLHSEAEDNESFAIDV